MFKNFNLIRQPKNCQGNYSASATMFRASYFHVISRNPTKFIIKLDKKVLWSKNRSSSLIARTTTTKPLLQCLKYLALQLIGDTIILKILKGAVINYWGGRAGKFWGRAMFFWAPIWGGPQFYGPTFRGGLQFLGAFH